MPKPPKKEDDKTRHQREDEVLRRLLKTPPKPHKPKDGKARKDAPDK